MHQELLLVKCYIIIFFIESETMKGLIAQRISTIYPYLHKATHLHVMMKLFKLTKFISQLISVCVYICKKQQFMHTVNGDGSKTAKKNHKNALLTILTSPHCQC